MDKSRPQSIPISANQIHPNPSEREPHDKATYGKHFIRYTGPKLWSLIPKNIRDLATLGSLTNHNSDAENNVD